MWLLLSISNIFSWNPCCACGWSTRKCQSLLQFLGKLEQRIFFTSLTYSRGYICISFLLKFHHSWTSQGVSAPSPSDLGGRKISKEFFFFVSFLILSNVVWLDCCCCCFFFFNFISLEWNMELIRYQGIQGLHLEPGHSKLYPSM